MREADGFETVGDMSGWLVRSIGEEGEEVGYPEEDLVREGEDCGGLSVPGSTRWKVVFMASEQLRWTENVVEGWEVHVKVVMARLRLSLRGQGKGRVVMSSLGE